MLMSDRTSVKRRAGGWTSPGAEDAVVLGLTNAMPQGRDSFIREIFAATAPDIDFLSSSFSFGLDARWRKRLVSLLGLAGKERVLDLCTGTGKLALMLLEKVEKDGSVTGIDFSSEMLREARRKPGAGSSAIRFQLGDAKDLEFPPESFDAVTVSFGMRNIPDSAAALREAYRVLTPGGTFCCLELTHPEGHWIKPFYTFYCFRVMPFIATRVLKTAVPYNYLPRSIKAFPTHEAFKEILEGCGFADVRIHSLTFGIATIFEARKPG